MFANVFLMFWKDCLVSYPFVENSASDSDVFVLTVSPQPSKPQGFCLWLTTHLAHLFTFHRDGNLFTPVKKQQTYQFYFQQISAFFHMEIRSKKNGFRPGKKSNLEGFLILIWLNTLVSAKCF